VKAYVYVVLHHRCPSLVTLRASLGPSPDSQHQMAGFHGLHEDHSMYPNNPQRGSQEQDGGGDGRAGSSEQNGRASPTAIFNPYYTGRPRTPANGSKHAPIDRQEIIRKIKSRDSRPTSPELERPSSAHSKKRKSPTPFPAPGLLFERQPRSPDVTDHQSIGMQIERPRSALHRGDFRERANEPSAFHRFGDGTRDDPAPSLSTSPVAPWHSQFPSTAFRQPKQDQQRSSSPPHLQTHRPSRARATSNASLAASFVYKPPTSPLVQSSRPDTPDPGRRRMSRSPDKSRRHTISPQSLQYYHPAIAYPASARGYQVPVPTLRAERTFPYQAHQPRRSLNSATSLPQTPASRPRQPSFSDSPLLHAPLVGSYEESILRGRMSTTPSKPLNFVAQIGVLGRGNCKSNLRCPPHVTVPFPAVFYSYNSGANMSADQPSPYVGMVDLENNLPSAEPSPEKRRQRLEALLSDEGSRASSRTREDGSASEVQARRRRRHKQKRRSGSPKAPPGGSYRIPQQGQLQIIIKNPNKTAVKLFLVSYDLSEMEPGQKTFIRQRSYSAGPIIDMPMASRKNLGTDRPEAALSASDDPNERPMLRYLVHLHICCPSKGRYFLYKSVRVVFANRVPDGKEKLRNEIQLPEPRYSTYKPSRASTISGASNTPPVPAHGPGVFDVSPSAAVERPRPHGHRAWPHSLPSDDYYPHFDRPVHSLPFHIDVLPSLASRPTSRHTSSDGIDLNSEHSHETQSSDTSFPRNDGDISPMSSLPTLDDPFTFDRDRSRDRGRYAGRSSEGLLSRRLKDLVVQGGQLHGQVHDDVG